MKNACVGSILIEALVYCMLAGLLAALLYPQSVRILLAVQTVSATSQQQAALYTVISALRLDMQQAYKARLNNQHALTLYEGQQTITWALDTHQRLTRHSTRVGHHTVTSVILDNIDVFHVHEAKGTDNIQFITINLTHNSIKNYEIFQSILAKKPV